MCEQMQEQFDGKQITIYKCEAKTAPIVYANMVTDSGKTVLDACRTLGCVPFHFVTVTRLRWDEELSPWPHEPIVSKRDHFSGEADEYMRCMADKIIPYAENKLGQPHRRILAGYSMGGLFALYAPYLTNLFSSVVAASGSTWYPNFVQYVREHEFLKKPDAVYLSLGNLECRTKNQYLCRTEDCMKQLHEIYQGKDIRSVFEINPGNHFKDAAYRLAKGITWAFQQGE